jgi:glycine hydroxymethyltransferase
VNFSGLLYKIVSYGVNDQGLIDYDRMRSLAREHKPRMIVAGYSAYSRHLDYAAFAEVAKEVGATFWVDMAHFAGLVATKLSPSPMPFADVVTTATHKTLRGPRGGMILCKAEHQKAVDKAVFPGTQGGPLMHVIAAKAVAFREALQPQFTTYCEHIVKNAKALAGALSAHGFHIVSGGTDNHLMLIDLRSKGLTGKVAEKALDRAGITVNKNTVPKETESPFVTSGIRIGTPAVTTRGLREQEMRTVADLIARVLAAPDDESVVGRAREEVRSLAQSFPLYP